MLNDIGFLKTTHRILSERVEFRLSNSLHPPSLKYTKLSYTILVQNEWYKFMFHQYTKDLALFVAVRHIQRTRYETPPAADWRGWGSGHACKMQYCNMWPVTRDTSPNHFCLMKLTACVSVEWYCHSAYVSDTKQLGKWSNAAACVNCYLSGSLAEEVGQ